MPTATLKPPVESKALGVPIDPEALFEVINGEIKEIAHMSLYANLIATALSGFLWAFVHSHRLGYVGLEWLFKLNSKRSRRPDIAFVHHDRLPSGFSFQDNQNEFACAPNLAVEVISPTNTAVEIETKRQEYFAAGVDMVWVVFPNQRTIHVFESLSTCRILEEQDELDGGKVLPGFKLKIADLFS